MRALRPKPRWYHWTIASIAVIVALPFVVAFVLVRSSWGQERLKNLAVQAIRDEAGLVAQVHRMDIRVAPLEIRAEGVTLEHPTEGELAQTEAVVLRPSALALLRGVLDLRQVEIVQPRIRLRIVDGRVVNLPTLASTGGDTRLPFRSLVFDGAEVTAEAPPFATARLGGVRVGVASGNGRDATIDFDLERGRIDHATASEFIQELKGRVELSASAIRVPSFVLRTPHVQAEIANGAAPIPYRGTIEGHVKTVIDLGHLTSLPLGWSLPLTGTVRAEGFLALGREGPRGNGHIALANVMLDRYGLGLVELEVEVSPDRITVTQGHAQIVHGGGTVDLRGSVGLGAGFPLEVSVDIQDLQFARLMEQLGVTPNAIVAWVLSGHVDLRGTASPLAMNGPIRTTTRDFLVTADAWHVQPQRRIIGASRATVVGSVVVRPDSLRFANLVADLPHSRIAADVLLGFDNTLHVQGSGTTLDLADVTPLIDFPLTGQGTASIDVRGPMGNPAITGNLKFADFGFDTLPFGNIESEMRLEKDCEALRFPLIRAVKHNSRYTIRDLLLDFRESRLAITGLVDARPVTLADFYHVFHYENDERYQPYQATVTGTADVRYTQGFPSDSPAGTLTVAMDFDLRDAVLEGIGFQEGAFLGEWRWLHPDQDAQGGELAIEHLHLRKGDGTLVVGGGIALGGTLMMDVAADALQVSELEPLAVHVPQLGGLLSVVGSVEGSTEIPRASLDVDLAGLRWSGRHLGDGRAYVRMTDRWDPWVRAAEDWNPDAPALDACARARVGLWNAEWPPDPPIRTRNGLVSPTHGPMAYLVCGEALDGAVRIDLAIGRTQQLPLRGRLSVAGLAIDPFLPDVAATDPLHARISGHLGFVDGGLVEPATLSGNAVLTSLAVSQRQWHAENFGDIVAGFDHGVVDIVSAIVRGPASSISVTGGASLHAGLALTVEGSLDLGLASALSPRIDSAAGRVGLRVRLSGPLEEPLVYGEARVQGGTFRYAGFHEPVHDLRGHVTFGAQRVVLDDFEAGIAGGHLALSGAAQLEGRGLREYDFRIVAEHVRISPEPSVSAEFGGDVRLRWSSERRLPRLEGAVRIEQASYSRPVTLLPTLAELSRGPRPEADRYDPEADHVELDLSVTSERPLAFSNELIDAELRIDTSERPFQIVGTNQRFGFLGTLAVNRGLVRFRNREFEVRRGTLEFDDAYRIDPHFDVLAGTEIRRSGDLAGMNWQIALHAHGTRDAFQLDMSSDPALSQEDLGLLLTLGMTRSEFDQIQQGDMSGAMALEALATATGAAREVRRAVPVDDFQFSSAYSPVTNRTEPRIFAGKRISNRVRLSASRSLGESGETRGGVEWELSDHTSVQAVYDNANATTTSTVGNLGVDLRWRLEFE